MPTECFNPEIDTGDFDPVEQQMIIDAQSDQKAFARIVTTEMIKGRKRCSRTTQNFDRRIGTLERWKVYVLGAVAGVTGVTAVIVFVVWLMNVVKG